MKLKTAFLIVLHCLFLSAKGQKLNDDYDQIFNSLKKDYLKFEQEHGHYIQTENVNMHYLSWGNPSAKPFVWIHGTYSNAYEFYSYADALVNEGYYVIAIDYFGHGHTDIATKPYTLYHVADDIKFLLDSLKIKKAIIGGWSRGGSIATAFYDEYPEYVSGIILEDGGSVPWATINHRHSIDSITAKFTRDFNEYSKNANKEYDSQMEAVKDLAHFKDKGRVYYAFAAVKQAPSGKWVENLNLAKNLGEDSIEVFLQMFYRPFGSEKYFGVSTILLNPTLIYRNLKTPILILDPVSDKDQFEFEQENSKLQNGNPTYITHKIYENTHHGLKFQRPEEFLKDVKWFVSNIKYHDR